ncbi:MAG: beta-glucuronidase, partial [Bacteroidota bacterium]|nr:beta-glucuronidase [Bacteroidota bacterium]
VEFRPLVQPIDTWFLNRRLGMLFEAKVGNGKLMVCSADLANDLDKRPVARQLLYSLTQYMESDKFVPQCSVELSTVKELFENKDRSVYRIYTKDSPDELKKNVK